VEDKDIYIEPRISHELALGRFADVVVLHGRYLAGCSRHLKTLVRKRDGPDWCGVGSTCEAVQPLVEGLCCV
jgi:hypothetical protein